MAASSNEQIHVVRCLPASDSTMQHRRSWRALIYLTASLLSLASRRTGSAAHGDRSRLQAALSARQLLVLQAIWVTLLRAHQQAVVSWQSPLTPAEAAGRAVPYCRNHRMVQVVQLIWEYHRRYGRAALVVQLIRGHMIAAGSYQHTLLAAPTCRHCASWTVKASPFCAAKVVQQRAWCLVQQMCPWQTQLIAQTLGPTPPQ